MLITYFILLILAVVFTTLHYPGTSLIFLVSLLFPLLDLIVQLIKKRSDKETRIWSAVSMIFWSGFFMFKFLYWPGSVILASVALLFTLIFLIRVFQKKNAVNYRVYVVLLIAAFGIFNMTMTGSKFRMFYMTEDPFSKEEQVPHFFRQKLAFAFYNEGDYAKAEQLIEMNIDHLEKLIAQGNSTNYESEADQNNLKQSQLDLEMIQKRSWLTFTPLFPEDRPE